LLYTSFYYLISRERNVVPLYKSNELIREYHHCVLLHYICTYHLPREDDDDTSLFFVGDNDEPCREEEEEEY